MSREIKKSYTVAIHTLSIIVFICIASPALAEIPAGIVLYYRDGPQVFLLLANDSHTVRGWGAYGGGANPGETEW